MRSTSIYPVRGGCMVLAYSRWVFEWQIVVPDYDQATEIARQWRHDGVRHEGEKS